MPPALSLAASAPTHQRPRVHASRSAMSAESSSAAPGRRDRFHAQLSRRTASLPNVRRVLWWEPSFSGHWWCLAVHVRPALIGIWNKRLVLAIRHGTIWPLGPAIATVGTNAVFGRDRWRLHSRSRSRYVG